MSKDQPFDEELIEEARRLGGHRTIEEAVIAALREYVGRLRRLAVLEMAGTIDFDPDYDYKAERKATSRRKRDADT